MSCSDESECLASLGPSFQVLNKYDLFVGSQATDFGEALTRHDEF